MLPKMYLIKPRIQLPYKRLLTLEAKIDWPANLENYLVSHQKENFKSGAWNNGVIGELLLQNTEEKNSLEASPIQKDGAFRRLKSESNNFDAVYMAITFYELLDEAQDFEQRLVMLKTQFPHASLFLILDFIPLDQYRYYTPGLETLLLRLRDLSDFKLVPIAQFVQMTFSRKTAFIHLHNKLFHYSSHIEVRAKMNGASVLYEHPGQEMKLDSSDSEECARIFSKNFLSLEELSFFKTISSRMDFWPCL